MKLIRKILDLMPISEETKDVQALLREHPNTEAKVVGRGLLCLDPEVIRESEAFQTFFEQGEIVRMARRMYQGDHRLASAWLNTPSDKLAGETPLRHSKTKDGVERVKKLIHQL